MSDDDTSIDVQLICNQRVVTYNKFLGMDPIGLISLWSDCLEIIFFHPVKKSRDEPNGP